MQSEPIATTSVPRPATLFDKIWERHVVRDLGDGFSLLWVDRHLIHDLGSDLFGVLRSKGRDIRYPDLTFATPDHGISTEPGRGGTTPVGQRIWRELREEAAAAGVRCNDVGSGRQGIVHVIGPELGLSLPGSLIVCCDSHTCTHGGVGAMGFGIGSSEVVHVFATQTLVQRRPKTMRVHFEGTPPPGVGPKDMILHLIGRIGASGGDGYAIEYAGGVIRAMGIEGRLTLCNLSIELGAKVGLVAPDDATFDYLHGRLYAPKEAMWDRAVGYWSLLPSDPGAHFDRELTIDVADLAPQVTWGISPEHVIGIEGRVPDPKQAPDARSRAAIRAALDYMDLVPGAPIAGTKIDWVFIGSCTNSRLSDLRTAAEVVRGRKVAGHVTAWVVPGSEGVKRDAEAEGIDRIFRAAGFEWRDPGCSMCLAINGETVPPGQRAVSTSNRNFVGRQGPGARTHLASPAMAAAAAIAGAITDVRRLGD